MKVLLIGNFTNNSTGYYYALQSIRTSLQVHKNSGFIEEFTTCNFSKLNKIEKKYDICFILIHPSLLLKNIDTEILRVSTLCKRKYLHILWETSSLPNSWNPLWSSDLFTGFTTPSRFFKILIEQKTDKSVYYTPYGIQKSKKIINPIMKKDERYFNILVIGQTTKRKGIEDAIISYVRTFSELENNKAKLFLKCFEVSQYEDKLSKIVENKIFMNSSNIENLRIYSIDNDTTKDELFDLYRSSSLLLFPSRGEGFALPPLEAMSIGLPVIYTDWSNLPEVCNPAKENQIMNKNCANLPIDYILDEAIDMKQYDYDIVTKYAYPLISYIMKKLLYKYNQWEENRENYYKSSQYNIDLIQDYFSLEKVSEYYFSILKGD